MSFLRRNDNDENNQTAPAPPPPAPGQPSASYTPPPVTTDPAVPSAAPAATSDDSSSGGGIIGWLGDTYNGIYKIVLEPSMPSWSSVLLLIAGVVIGLVWAYLLFPTIFFDANPNRLNQPAQNQWARMVAVGRADSGVQYPTEAALNILAQIPNPSETIQRLIEEGGVEGGELQALTSLLAVIPENFESAQPVVPNDTLTDLLISALLPLLIMLIAFPILVLLWRLLIYPNIVAGLIDRFRRATNQEYAEQQRKAAQARQAARAAADARKNLVIQSDENLGEPVMKTISIFDSGRSYDDSFEIELPLDQGGDFLGQSGAVLAEATDPDPVAIELWLFDMFKSETLKKIFVTQAGYNDPSIRGRLEADVKDPATDIAVAQPGTKLIIESDKLRLQGELGDLSINNNGRFEHFKMTIAAWQKGAAAPAAPAVTTAPSIPAAPPAIAPAPGSRDMAEYDNIQFDPPPAPTSGSRPLSDYDNIQFDPPPQTPSAPSSRPAMFEMDDYEEGATEMMPPVAPNESGSGRLTPPPLAAPPGFNLPPDDDDDDPFGGTGDFTPLPNR